MEPPPLSKAAALLWAFLLLALGGAALVIFSDLLLVGGFLLASGGLRLLSILAPGRVPRVPRSLGFAVEILQALVAVAAIVVVARSATGTWPVMVAVESGSMEPNINTGDLVFILGLNRSNVTTLRDGAPLGYQTFARHPDAQGNTVFGDVIVFYPNGNTGCTPIIHRVLRWVGLAEPIHEAARYPALHAGYITKGDNNPTVDQGGSFSRHCPNNLPVKPEWIVGVSRFRVPILGYFRLLFPR